jgi:hypothetical protein
VLASWGCCDNEVKRSIKWDNGLRGWRSWALRTVSGRDWGRSKGKSHQVRVFELLLQGKRACVTSSTSVSMVDAQQTFPECHGVYSHDGTWATWGGIMWLSATEHCNRQPHPAQEKDFSYWLFVDFFSVLTLWEAFLSKTSCRNAEWRIQLQCAVFSQFFKRYAINVIYDTFRDI